jgi:tetratricopeptide (TPR) repeat protein
MTTKYRCVNCDEVFEAGETKGEPRCPKCHHVHDVVRVAGPAAVPWYKRSSTLGGAALLGILGAGVVVWVLRMRPAEQAAADQPAIPAASRDELTALVAKAPGVPGSDLLTGKASGSADAKALALAKVLRALADNGSWKIVDAEAPMDLAERELLDPAPLLQKLGPAAPTVTSLEAALLALRLARAAGLQATVVRVERFGDRNTPADPSGLFGHYAVAVGSAKPPLLLDPTLEGGAAAGPAETAPMTDGECGGVLEAYRALQQFLPRQDRPQPNPLAAKEHLDKARELAPKLAPVRMVAAFVAMAQDPGSAFAGIDELLRDASPSQKVAVAELYIGLGRLAEVEALLADAEKIYPGWVRIPLVRGQLAMFRAGALLTAARVAANPSMVRPEQAAQVAQQLQALGLSASDSVDDQFTLLRRYVEDAERLGGSPSTTKLRQMYAATYSEYRLGAGDVDGARKALEAALAADPTSVIVAVPLAGVMIAQNDSLNARKMLEPVATAAKTSADDLMRAADEIANRIRASRPAPAAETGSPFDLSAPAAPSPTSEPSLQMPSLGTGRPGGLGQGLQINW